MSDEKKEEKQVFKAVEIPTATKAYIVRGEGDKQEQYTVELALAKIMNDLEEIKSVVG